MAQITIDRLALKLSRLSEEEARRLSSLIAQGLAAAPPVGHSRRVDALKVNVTAESGSSLERIAEQVVSDLLRQLDRTL